MLEAGGMSEELLLADARRGDEAAFERLGDPHLYRFFPVSKEFLCRTDESGARSDSLPMTA